MALYPPRTPGRRISSEQSRELLLDSTAKAIGGPDVERLDLLNFSFEDAINESGIARSAAYTHFGNIANFRQALINRLSEGDLYSLDTLRHSTNDLLAEALRDNLELRHTVSRFGGQIVKTAFTKLTLDLEKITKLQGADGLAYPVAAQSIAGQQAALHTLAEESLLAIHDAAGQNEPVDIADYADDFLNTGRGIAAYNISSKAVANTFGAIVDTYMRL